MAEPQPNNDREQRLDSIILEYLESVERGAPSSAKTWIERYPDLADQLAAFFAAEEEFDRMVAPLRGDSSLTRDTPAPSSTVPGEMFPLRTIQDYELLSEIGRGGMGVIYKARQRSLNRLVAIKMLRSAEWATAEERLRFRWEAETVATLDHPNIVPIYEVGEVTSEGTQLPFFSMKLIEGENLSQARERFHNDWKCISRLLCLIARAIEHAHQRGVLHRDLKPGNVLLKISSETPSSEEFRLSSGLLVDGSFITPHISDFGLARRAQHQRGGTLPGAIIGTPSYLAPELTRGHEFATIASDIYSLGVILYEFLTGVPPFQAESPLRIIQLVAANVVTAPRKVNPTIPYDLETICLKCLETDATKRYSSANKLAEDLEHFLAHRPISARPIGGMSRFVRWCRRQPVIAGLSAALLLAVLVGLPLVIWNWRRAVEQEQLAQNRLDEMQKQRDRADDAFNLAEKRLGETREQRDRADDAFGLAHRVISDNFRLMAEERREELPPASPSRKQLLENGLNYYRAFVARHRDDPKLRREVAKAMSHIGEISIQVGPAHDTVENYQTAINLWRSLAKEYPTEAEIRENLGQNLTNVGTAFSVMNRLDAAITAYDEAIAVWAQLQKERPDNPKYPKEQALAWLNRGVALQSTGNWQRVLESHQCGQVILSESGLAKERRLMVLLLVNISQAEDNLGRQEDALRDAREAVRLAGEMLSAVPHSEDAQVSLGYSARSVGKLLRERGDLAGAKVNLQLSWKCLTELHQRHPRVTQYSWNLSQLNEELAAVAEKQNQLFETLHSLLSAEILMKELVELDGESHPNRSSLARIERRLAEIHQKLKNLDATQKAFEQAKIHMEYLLNHNTFIPTIRTDLARVCHQLGVTYARLNKYPEAADAAAEAIKHYRIILKQSPNNTNAHKNLSSVLGNLAIAKRSLRRLPEALKATEDRVKLWPKNPVELYDAATDFARTYDSAVKVGVSATSERDQAIKDAIDALQQAIRAGFKDNANIHKDGRFAQIIKTPEFQTFLKELDTKQP